MLPALAVMSYLLSWWKYILTLVVNEECGEWREEKEEIEAEENVAKKTHLLSNYRKKKEQFESIFDPEVHAALVKRGERRFTHKALLGALMIVSYW